MKWVIPEYHLIKKEQPIFSSGIRPHNSKHFKRTIFSMDNSLKKLLLAGILVEILIFLFCSLTYEATADVFRYAARYSGRFSFGIFIYAFYFFATGQPKPFLENNKLGNIIRLFAIMHVIHFGFLATCVYLNSIPLETVKVIGGALAYLMIVMAPLKLAAVNFKAQLVYFYYVSLVMALTYVARIKGDFQGAEPFWFHYVGLGLMALCCLLFGVIIYRSRKSVN
ncbi:MAG: hypothetical protein AB8B53_05070 [Flavobacteriales bacterium]